MHYVHAYGVIAPSTLIELSDDDPSPGGYAEIAGVHPSIGGTAGGAYVLARLGVATKLNGKRFGDDDSSVRTLGLFTAAGVDCGAITSEPHLPPVGEVVLVTDDARTVLGTYRRTSPFQTVTNVPAGYTWASD